jgi:hypothetical protein
MKELKYTLIADGSSDKTLIRIIKWLLDDLYPKMPAEGMLADFRGLPNPPKTLNDKLKTAKRYFPADIVFIHRDAESVNPKSINQRLTEIQREIGEREFEKSVCIIPIKMMETWLLIDPDAIKKAAGNRNYSGNINLPPLKRLEKENQPKKLLHELLLDASGLKGRNLRKFNVDRAVHLVSDNIQSYNVLRELEAFSVFEKNLTAVMDIYFSENEKMLCRDDNRRKLGK